MRELILVRHGESEHRSRAFTGGWTDLPLTARGREQAKRTAMRLLERLPDLDTRPVALYTSDLIRARDTATSIAEAIGSKVHIDADLRELDNGAARGRTRAQAKEFHRLPTEPILD